jgi:hypothetical protein
MGTKIVQATALLACLLCLVTPAEKMRARAGSRQPPIDRRALVRRHNITITRPDPLTPLSVGNGEFAFTVDITGLQTFPDFHARDMPLGTQSQWGWHSMPNPQRFTLDEVQTDYDAHGRLVPYADNSGSGRREAANRWLRANPHRLDLGRIALVLRRADGSAAELKDLVKARQTLDLWNGLLESRFEFDSQPVLIQTVCHPERDQIAVRIESALLGTGRLHLLIAFPYASDVANGSPADWSRPDRHQTVLTKRGNLGRFARTLDETRYYAAARWSDGSDLRQTMPHHYELVPTAPGPLELSVAFSPELVEQVSSFAETAAAARAHWNKFWSTGGAIDLSASRDPRWKELERRIVLSQYLTAINCAGHLPPQETGLVTNSWHGKFHLEMHWWHAAHFALWDRTALLERSLRWYEEILPVARAKAQRQGYAGARWPKMVGPDGRDSPSGVGEFLIWQQPHPIYYAELCYRAHPGRDVLERYRSIVFATADFMASYAAFDRAQNRYVLGPPVIPAQESYGPDRARVCNPTFELAYWYWGLATAQRWRARLGMGPNPEWDRVLTRLSKPTVRDGVYTAIETPPYTVPHDHPSMVAALGFLPPTPLIDRAIMDRTLEHVFKTWQWESTWGWDYPMLAMTAARLGKPERAIDALLIETPKNRYLANGHNYQRPGLPLYLPGNGGLLAAVAMMAAGWDGAPHQDAPGFPANGQWVVRWEGLKTAP